MQVALPDISQSFQKTKGFFTEQFGKAVNSASEVTAQAKSSLSETAANAKEIITQTTNSAVNTIDQTTSKAVDLVNQTTEKAKASLQDSFHKAGNISGAASDTIQNAINATVKDWIDAHPIIFWLLSHPLITLALLLLSIFIILGLFQALGRFFAEGWLFILQSPGKFIQGVFSVASKSVSNLGGIAVNSLVLREVGENNNNNNSALLLKGDELNSLESQERLTNILTRLEAIREEQNQLLQEASAILGKQFKAE